jgi:hypothetical protein
MAARGNGWQQLSARGSTSENGGVRSQKRALWSPHASASVTSLLLALVGIALSVSAQTYSIDAYKIAGDGGTSTGGVYSVSDTIGQPDAG